MKYLVMVGGGPGSLPRNYIEAIEAQGRALTGYIDIADESAPLMHPRPRLGDDRLLDDPAFIAAHDFVIAVRGPRRLATCEKLLKRDASLPVIVHPAAAVSVTATIGVGTIVSAGAIIQQDARVGRFCILNTSCSIDHDSVIGDHVSVSPGARTAGNVTIEDNVFVGLGALIIGGVTVGAGATLGAGAVVLRNVAGGSTVVGNPAKPLVRV
ncbi:NeuD/PglB/VioB family sugar acetyltransferase [Bradyrhizobium sp. LHD-71]|uniref:NeuD/PglB/VioB family sugar acetyltransferase n=1 Tax=Bradyrhizobium sp. LHD-71 TaxID=3072141 RepID=UPI00280F0DCB|nr:NeuD/PglB/VioB family sugar acetyltransferase [Bradyrhizobium sp. LHD-71]MDQ8732459.1 NeuD/PglB/VioB family sugar acetyltransferase [Bradyrhizobium sp. LHD-71]